MKNYWEKVLSELILLLKLAARKTSQRLALICYKTGNLGNTHMFCLQLIFLFSLVKLEF